MKTFYLVAFLFCLSSAAIAQHKTDTLFFEDFNGKTLDRLKWNVEVTGHTVNNEQQAYVDSASVLSQADSKLSIKPVYHPRYISQQQNKYVSCRGG